MAGLDKVQGRMMMVNPVVATVIDPQTLAGSLRNLSSVHLVHRILQNTRDVDESDGVENSIFQKSQIRNVTERRLRKWIKRDQKARVQLDESKGTWNIIPFFTKHDQHFFTSSRSGGLDSGDVMIMHGLPNGRVKAALRAHSEAVRRFREHNGSCSILT